MMSVTAIFLFALIRVCYCTVMLHYTVEEDIDRDQILGNIISDAKLDIKYPASVVHSLRLKILPSRYTRYFILAEIGGGISTNGSLDRDMICAGMMRCNILLDVAIVEPVPFKDVFKVNVSLLDTNDNSPQFTDSIVKLSVSESAEVGFSFMLPTANDIDSGPRGVQRYTLDADPSLPFHLFSVDNPDGSIDLSLELTSGLDREEQTSYTAVLNAYDGGDVPRSGSVSLTISVLDNNDNRPTFIGTPYDVIVDEDVALATPIIRVYASDVDSDHNGRVEYSFDDRTQRDHGDRFFINRTSGEVSVIQTLDFETETSYQLFVTASDSGNRPLSVTERINIRVRDINDHRPQITVNALTASGRMEVSEFASNATYVALILIEDGDGGVNGEVECHLTATRFSLESMLPKEYKIVTTANFDRESEALHRITLTCSDSGDPSLTTTRNINVTIVDENDHSPRFTNHTYEVVVQENTTSVVMPIEATDMDVGDNGRVSYTLMGDDAGMLQINSVNGDISAVTPFDYEQMKTYEFLVVAMDHGSPPRRTTTSVTLRIADVNDETPTFTDESYSFETFENQPVDTQVGQVHAEDADTEPFNEFTYVLIGQPDAMDAFRVDPTTGIIRLHQLLDRERTPVFRLIVAAIETAIPPKFSSTVTVIIDVADRNDNPPVIRFPQSANQSLVISAAAPVGHVFARVVASDADSGVYGRLVYSMTSDDSGGMFAVDEYSGDVSIWSDLRASGGRNFRLAVRVRDGGDRSALAVLIVVVNASLPFNGSFPSSASRDGSILSYHQMIVVVIAAITIVVVSVLLTAIVLIRRRHNVYVKSVSRHLVVGSGTNMLVSVYEGSTHEMKEARYNTKQQIPCNIHANDDRGQQYRTGYAPSVAISYDVPMNAQRIAGNTDRRSQNKGVEIDSVEWMGDRDSSSVSDVSNADSGRGSDEGERRQSSLNASSTVTSQPKLPPRSAPKTVSSATKVVYVAPPQRSKRTPKMAPSDGVKKCVQFKDDVPANRPKTHESDDESNTLGSYVIDIEHTLHGVTV